MIRTEFTILIKKIFFINSFVQILFGKEIKIYYFCEPFFRLKIKQFN